MNEATAKTKFYRAATWLLLLLCLWVAVKVVAEGRAYKFIGQGVQPVSTITVSGQGEKLVTPDIAEMSFGVVASAKGVKAAQAEATVVGNRVIDYLKKAGVAEKDIKTTGYSLSPQFSTQYDNRPVICNEGLCPPPRPPVLTGYEVRQSLQVTLRDLTKVGEILAGVGETGVTDINGPYFKVAKEEQIKMETRALAIKDAQAKARALARDLGVSLSRVIEFNEAGGYPIYALKAADGRGGATEAVPEIPAGENRITSEVTLVYEIR